MRGEHVNSKLGTLLVLGLGLVCGNVLADLRVRVLSTVLCWFFE